MEIPIPRLVLCALLLLASGPAGRLLAQDWVEYVDESALRIVADETDPDPLSRSWSG